MKYTRRDFLTARDGSIAVDEQISVEEGEFLHQTQVRSIPECTITGTLQYDGESQVSSDLEISGVMIVPDSITDEDVEIEFETESETVYSFEPVDSDDEDIIVVKKDTIDLNPEIIQAIVFEAPMSITRLSREQYPSGDGWSLTSDQDKPEKDDEIDPRWAKLKDFSFNDD